MRPATIDEQKIPAPSSSLIINLGLSSAAAAIDENMSGQPLPKASKVTPCKCNALVGESC